MAPNTSEEKSGTGNALDPKNIDLRKLSSYSDTELNAARVESARQNMFGCDYFGEAIQDEIDERYRQKTLRNAANAVTIANHSYMVLPWSVLMMKVYASGGTEPATHSHILRM
ncbi:MAG: hypothetical protein LBJ45_02580 [Holosporaceae bacterium]|nr:hypothetical protein [Holosporaceae bacterium]